jgi:hypothetical protein
MNDLGGVSLLFALRCIVPLAITVSLGYAAQRMYARWQAEAGIKPRAVPKPVLRTADGPDCWTVNGCSAASRQKCPAYQRPELTCWSARMIQEGALPTNCATCLLFSPALNSVSTSVPPSVRGA